MNKTIVGKIDCSKINKEKLFSGKKGEKWLDIIMIPTPDSKYGDDYFIAQSATKEERAQGVRGKILGNCKFLEKSPTAPRAVAGQDSKPEDSSDIPF